VRDPRGTQAGETEDVMVNHQSPAPERCAVQGEHLVDRVNELVHEGNVRRIIIRHEGHTILELPLTVGVIGALFAPRLAAVGAIAALLTESTVEVEREPSGEVEACQAVVSNDAAPQRP
jgi:hypothetical protein